MRFKSGRTQGKLGVEHQVRHDSSVMCKSVGEMRVQLVAAYGLQAADFMGTSDPFVVLEMDGQRFQSSVLSSTLNPKWMDEQVVVFQVLDVSSVLFITVYDQDRFGEPEFLGKAALPVCVIPSQKTIQLQTRKLPLKNRHLTKPAKGCDPHVELKVHKSWSPVMVAMAAVSPNSRPENCLDCFKAQAFVANVQRVKDILNDAVRALRFAQSCFEWTYPSRSVKALISFILFTYYVELFMVPLLFLGYIFIGPLLKQLGLPGFKGDGVGEEDPDRRGQSPAEEGGNETNCGNTEDEEDEGEDNPSEGCRSAEGLSGKLKALHVVTLFVQNALGSAASLVESFWHLLHFTVPFLSWMCVLFLFVSSIILYAVPLRWIIMVWGVNKFSKKLIRPDHVPTSELLNFLSRVPDKPTHLKCFSDYNRHRPEKHMDQGAPAYLEEACKDDSPTKRPAKSSRARLSFKMPHFTLPGKS